jgi:hypothetical protein
VANVEHDEDGDDLEQTEEPVGADEKDSALVFGGGAVLGAALLAIVWMVVSVVNGGSDPESTPATAEVRRPAAPAVTTPQPSRQDRCQQAMNTLSEPLQAAQPAMDQWEVHIGAMNKLVVGAITLQQATAFWDQTRIGAEHRITEFRESVRSMRHTPVDCPSTVPPTAAPALRACVRRVDADRRAIRAARTAIATWDMHVTDMERLRTGKLSAAKAGAMWVAMWQRGQDELKAYRTAIRDARRAGSCDGSAAEPPQAAAPSPGASPSMDMPGMG